MTLDLNSPLCLSELGFPGSSLKSAGVSEIRPYVASKAAEIDGIAAQSLRLQRLLSVSEPIPTDYKPGFNLELETLGSLEQPVLITPKGTLGSAGGRGLICSCYGRRFLNATVRKSDKENGLPDYKSGVSTAAFKDATYKFAPDADRKEFYFSIEDNCRKLFDTVLMKNMRGLVVVAGGTGSAKSQLVRGLIHYHLLDKLASLRESSQRFHLLTIENPIEKFLFESSDGVPVDPNEIAAMTGIDYTPRQIPEDTPSLIQALMRDALRQTPSLTYVGEIREPDEFRTVLDFAETGQSIITTMHAGSLREAFQRLLMAAGAQTPGARAQIASRIRAVIHVQPLQNKLQCTVKKADGTSEIVDLKVSLPSVWVNSSIGVSNLVADGLSSLVPNAGIEDAYCFGRRYFLQPHSKNSQKYPQIIAGWDQVRTEAVTYDLGRGATK